MRSIAVLGFVFLANVCAYNYTELWYDGMPVDHFSYATNKTFFMRYLVNNEFWDKNSGPILFYCGNEGDITVFADNSGFIWDIAPTFKALIVFAEHRFYGKTMPFGNDSYASPKYLGYLSSEQVLSDYAVFLRWFKSSVSGAEHSRVIAFGGSYGGMLAAWFRMKYPNIVEGALAASAPIWQFNGITPCWSFNAVVTRTFAKSGKNCDACIKRSWDAFQEVASTSAGLQWINDQFKFCPDSQLKNASDIWTVFNWMQEIWTNFAMVDYPYPTSFLAPLPGWPVRKACKYLTDPKVDDKVLLTNIYKALSVYLNYTGSTSCYSTGQSASPLIGDFGWDFQACTEMVMPICSNGSDMFFKSDWNFTTISADCEKRFGVRSRLDFATTNYWGVDLREASNIIFSNGDLDPWSSGGVTTFVPGLAPKPDSNVFIINIKDSAHHYDLRGSNTDDTDAIKLARQQEVKVIKHWLTGGLTTSLVKVKKQRISTVFLRL